MTPRPLILANLFLFYSILPVANILSAQNVPEGTGTKEAKLVQRIAKAAEGYGKWKSNLLNNPEEIEKLREQAKSSDERLGTEAAKAQEILARLGGSEQLLQIACEFYHFDDGDFGPYAAAKKLQRVGGYASVRLLAEIILAPLDHAYSPPDEWLPARSFARRCALETLAGLVPEAGIQAQAWVEGSSPTEEQIRGWYNWIEKHKEQLSRLEPSDGPIPSQLDCRKMQGISISLSDVKSLMIETSEDSLGGIKPDKYQIFVHNGKLFLDELQIAPSALVDLLNALSLPITDSLSIVDLGLDDEWLAANADIALNDFLGEAVSDIQGQETTLSDEQKLNFFQLFTDRGEMESILHDLFSSEPSDGNRPQVGVMIMLKDGQTVELSSSGVGPFLLPWKFKSQGKTEFFDYRISLAVAALLPKNAPNEERLSVTGPYELRRQLAGQLAASVASQ